MFACKWVAKNLRRYEDGRLTGTMRDEIEQHLRTCVGCHHLHERIRAIRRALTELERLQRAA